MKTNLLIVIIIFMISSFNIKSQIFEPEQLQFSHFYEIGDISKTNSTFNTDNNRFKYDDIVLGWHWSWGRHVSNALSMNQSHVYDYLNHSKLMKDNVGIVLNIDGINTSSHVPYPLQSQCYVFKPTLQIIENSIPNLQKVEVNNSEFTEKYVFGFKNIIGEKAIDNSRLLINHNNISANTEILSGCWNNYGLHTFGESNGLGENDNYFGSKWRLCISVSRDGEWEDAGDDVLKITMPCKLGNGTPYSMIFRGIPSDINGDFINIYKDNNTSNPIIGKRQEIVTINEEGFTEFFIKKSMLPIDGSTIDIYAEFYTMLNPLWDYHNPAFQDCEVIFGNCESNKINEFDINVEYLRNCDVKIHNLRICTPNAYNLLWNQLNSQIHSYIQNALNIFEVETGTPANNNDFWQKQQIIKRIYMRDEGGPAYWAAYRYFQKLVGNIGTIECGPKFPELYNYYVEPTELWYSFGKTFHGMGAPFIKETNWKMENATNTKNMNFGEGYIYQNKPDCSHYETYLSGSKNFENMYNQTITQIDYANAGYSFQRIFETYLTQSFMEFGNTSLLFLDKKWWAQFNIDARFIKYYYDDNNIKSLLPSLRLTGGMRPANYHEISLLCYFPLIIGAKGVLLDGENTYSAIKHNPENEDCRVSLRKEINVLGFTKPGEEGYPDPESYWNNSSPDEIINDNTLGDDWIIRNVQSYSNLENQINWDYIDLATGKGTADLLPRPNKFFIGQQSNRRALFEFSKFVRNNELILNNLQLKTWLSKGYHKYYNQNPLLNPNFMDKFISTDISKWKTRPIGRIKSNGTPLYENKFENNLVDSSFFEATILADQINDPNMQNYFYTGVLNRRTDPILKTGENQFDFITEPEMEYLTNGEPTDVKANPAQFGQTKTVAEWRELYTKRLGCREITIPFNYCDPNNGNDYNLLHITEVKADDTFDNNWPWWRKERYYNYVDVVIGQNGSIPVNFLPGEGKIFKVEVLRPHATTGKLAYSNQSKFVVFPEYESGVATDKVRYHLTYQKPDVDRNNIMSVFYQRSFPMEKVSGKENLQIMWEAPVCVSDLINIPGEESNPLNPFNNLPAYYPSIVVRWDNNATKAYVVYSAEAVSPEYPCDPDICPPEIDLYCMRYKNPICESVLQVDGLTPNIISRNAIKNVVKGFRDNFGTPVVNASKDFNFYAWSDSVCGIVVGYKSPGSTFLSGITSLKAMNGYASHPSINAYSIFDKQENDCSIVWQEKSDLNYQPQIFYTKFRISGGNLQQFKPTNVYNLNDTWGNCLRLSGNIPGEMPTIYRIQRTQGSYDGFYAVREVIAWNSIPKLSIITRTFFNLYDNTKTEPYYLSFSSSINSIIGNNNSPLITTHNLSNPVMSQITSYLKNTGLGSTGSDYEYLINFEDAWQRNDINPSTYGNRIYHIRNNFYSSDLKVSDFKTLIYPIAEGQYPHLAYSPIENTNPNVWKNHRVYNQGTLGGYDRIVPNPIYFHEFNDCPSCQVTQKIVGFDTNPIKGGGLGNTSMSFPGIPVPEPLPINLPYQAVSDSLGEYVIPVQQDTIYTDWIQIDSTAELQYLVTMKDTTTVLFKLQKLSDSSYVDLPAPYTPGVIFSHQVFYLVNGNNDQYRLAMFNTDSTLEYGENMYFEAPFVIDTIYAKSSFEVKQNVINLNKNILIDKTFNLSCMPNPAKEILNVAVYANQNTNVESVVLQLYNQQGLMVWKNNSQINSTAAIPVDEFSNGMYLIRANITTKDGFYTETSKVLILK